MQIALLSPYEEQSYGIRILSSCLKREGHRVRLIFLPQYFLKRYEDTILQQLADLVVDCQMVGISLMSNNFDNAVQLTHFLKSRTNAPIVWGGVHPTVRPDECMEYADMVFIGEAEKSICEAAARLEAGKSCTCVKGIGHKSDGKSVITGLGDLAEDLNSLPFPDYDCADDYYLMDGSIQQIHTAQLNKIMDGVYITFPTRGCPFSCTYCFNYTLNQMYGKRSCFRKRSVDSLMAELKTMRDKFGGNIRLVTFDDDNLLMYSRSEIQSLCERYRTEIGLPLFIGGVSPETVDAEKIRYLAEAGLEEVRLGIQSGCQDVRDMYNRHHSNEKISAAIRILGTFRKKLKKISYDVIVDNPWETEEQTVESLRFLAKIPLPRHLIIYSLTFFPGTKLYEKAKQEGLIKDDLTDVYRKFYHGVKYTYINYLFYLLDDASGKRNSAWLIPLLTTRLFRRIKPIWLVLLIINPAKYVKRLLAA